MRCHSVPDGTEVLNDNSRCTWTLCSTQSRDGWPQRSQLQPGVPSLGCCVTLLPATFCNLGLGDLLSPCNKRIVFISYSFLLGNPPARNDLKLLLDYRAPPDDRQVTYVAFLATWIAPGRHNGNSTLTRESSRW